MSEVTVTTSTRKVHPLTLVCDRCHGAGFIARYAYKAKGRCFGCGGTGRKRDRDQVIEETRFTIHAPVGLSVIAKVVPSPDVVSRPVAVPRSPQNILAGLPWAEQARIRAMQNARAYSR